MPLQENPRYADDADFREFLMPDDSMEPSAAESEAFEVLAHYLAGNASLESAITALRSVHGPWLGHATIEFTDDAYVDGDAARGLLPNLLPPGYQDRLDALRRAL